MIAIIFSSTVHVLFQMTKLWISLLSLCYFLKTCECAINQENLQSSDKNQKRQERIPDMKKTNMDISQLSKGKAVYCI